MAEDAHESVGVIEPAPGTHMCCMYRGPQERDDLLLPFLSAGLDAGQTCFAAVNDPDPIRLRGYVEDDVPGKLILRTSDQPIFDPDSFDVESIIAFWEKTVTAELAEDGVDFVRLSAEATWWLTQVPALDDLMRYEGRLKDFASRHPAVDPLPLRHRSSRCGRRVLGHEARIRASGCPVWSWTTPSTS